jgi:hypothetical protein
VTLAELLQRIVTRLDEHGIAYMLTGSLAAAVHGAGRATMNADLVIDVDAERLDALVRGLTNPATYISLTAAREALEHRSMFNVVDIASGWKVDLIIRRDRPFSRIEFGRRQAVDVAGWRLWVATAEDIILAKLEWAKRGGVARQLEDVGVLLRVNQPDLDRDYLRRWVDVLGLQQEWQAAARA